MDFKVGDKVKIVKLSRETVETALRYKKTSPLVVCPCDLKEKALVIECLFENESLAIVRYGDSISVCKLKDLAFV